MEADKFSDPRKRSTRGHGRGRGRDRGRGQGRRSSKDRISGTSSIGAVRHQKLSHKKLAELGSNAYRFRQLEAEDEDQEDEFDVGVDFAEASTGPIAQGTNLLKNGAEDVSVHERMMEADLDGLEKALKSLPLWVRLGDVARFGLRVSNYEIEENYLEPVAEADSTLQPSLKLFSVTDDSATDFADAVASMVINDNDNVGVNASVESRKSDLTGRIKDEASNSTTPQRRANLSPPADDFDKWLDGV